jgi:hypothetical protein
MNVDFLKRSFSAYVELDACQHKLRIGIENLEQEINLFDYKWGEYVYR